MRTTSERSCGWDWRVRSRTLRLGLVALLIGFSGLVPATGALAEESVDPAPVVRPGALELVQQAVEDAEAAAATARMVAEQGYQAAQAPNAEHFTWDSGHTYSGQGIDNYANGLGVMNYPDGSVHAGQRTNRNARNGYGVEAYGDGNSYEGQFADDVRDGYGVFYYTDGSLYQGHWRDDWRSGFGRFIYPDGSIAYGWWHQDELVETY
ncbi:MAG: hypothetical protein H6843_02370 [Rhodospirillaceae bacterium]|nr:hypothetical protein [Rhodospirillaceae bacterium]